MPWWQAKHHCPVFLLISCLLSLSHASVSVSDAMVDQLDQKVESIRHGLYNWSLKEVQGCPQSSIDASWATPTLSIRDMKTD